MNNISKFLSTVVTFVLRPTYWKAMRWNIWLQASVSEWKSQSHFLFSSSVHFNSWCIIIRDLSFWKLHKACYTFWVEKQIINGVRTGCPVITDWSLAAQMTQANFGSQPAESRVFLMSTCCSKMGCYTLAVLWSHDEKILWVNKRPLATFVGCFDPSY